MKLLKKHQLKSEFDKETILIKLKEVTHTWHKELNKTQLFEGKINSDSFKLYPTYDIAPRDHFRPEIEIILKQKKNYTQVNLKFELPKLIKRFLPAAYIIYSLVQGVLIYIYLFKIDFNIPLPFIFSPIVLALLVFFQTKFLFHTRTKRALKHLTNILKLQVE